MRYANYYNSGRQTNLGFAGSLIGTQREAEILAQELLPSKRPDTTDFILAKK